MQEARPFEGCFRPVAYRERSVTQLPTLAVRDALLTTAQPCRPQQSYGQTECCLNGFIDLPAATRRILATTIGAQLQDV